MDSHLRAIATVLPLAAALLRGTPEWTSAGADRCPSAASTSRCRFPPRAPPLVDSFFDIFYTVSLDGITLRGVALGADGNPIGSFQTKPGAPPQQVQGQAQFAYPGGNQVDFTATFTSQLDQFLIDFPPGFQVQMGAAMGFSCQPIQFEGSPSNDALSCSGPVQPGVRIQGGLQLNQNPSGVHTNTRLYGGTGGQLFGPFPVSGP